MVRVVVVNVQYFTGTLAPDVLVTEVQGLNTKCARPRWGWAWEGGAHSLYGVILRETVFFNLFANL